MHLMKYPQTERHERIEAMSKPLTPKAENRAVTGWTWQVNSRGLCPKGKCFRRTGHTGACYPQ